MAPSSRESRSQNGITRREFLRRGFVLAAGAAAAGLVDGKPRVARATPVLQEENPTRWTREIIGSQDAFNPPQTVNGGETYLHYPHEVYSSAIRPGPFEIDGTFTVRPTEQTPEGTIGGILLTSGRVSNSPAENELLLSRNNGSHALVLELRQRGQPSRYRFEGASDSTVDFSLSVSADTSFIRANSPLGTLEVQLDKPLFTPDDKLRLMLVTGAHSGIDVNRLKIMAPPEQTVFPPGVPLRQLAQRKNLSIGVGEEIRRNLSDMRYEQLLANQFNHIVLDYEFWWSVMHRNQGENDFFRADQGVNFARRNGMDVFGQHFVWGENLPPWLTQGGFSRNELLEMLEQRMFMLMDRYKGIISQWVVVNEAIAPQGGGLRDNFWLKAIGPDYVERSFEIARRVAKQVAPETTLLYNDFGNDGVSRKTEDVKELLGPLKRKGLADGVGLQMHHWIGSPPVTDDVGRTMGQYKNLGLEVVITEIDVDTRGVRQMSQEQKFEEQKRIFRAMLRKALDNGLSRFSLGGLLDETSWLLSLGGESPHLFAKGQPKPSFLGLQEELAS